MKELLCLKGITKTFPGVVALNNINFSINKGEVCALLGKNGAGKSTLIKVLSGAYQPDCGEIIVRDKNVKIANPRDAFDLGISTVYQEMSLVPDLSVGENILLGRWRTKSILGLQIINKREVNKIASKSLKKLSISLPLEKKVSELNIAQKQICEIAKAISFDPAVLILDEPTSALANEEVEILHNVIRKITAQGHSVIYVTHRLQEIAMIADKVTVMRDGDNIGTFPVSEKTPGELVSMMAGTDIEQLGRNINKNKHIQRTGGPLLSVSNLSSKGLFNDISFSINKGEILGLAGLLGSGRTELVRSLIGLEKIDCGTLVFEGSEIKKPTVRKTKSLKIDMVPEDRKAHGFVPLFSVRENLSLSCLDRISRFGILNKVKEKEIAEQSISKLLVKTSNMETSVATLSGGNQQKVILGKCLNILPKLLILDEPTRGIDVHAKEQIYKILRNLCDKKGISIIFISSELEEVLLVSDRILIMHEGQICSEVVPEDVTVEKLTDMVIKGEKNG